MLISEILSKKTKPQNRIHHLRTLAHKANSWMKQHKANFNKWRLASVWRWRDVTSPAIRRGAGVFDISGGEYV
jgi:hypothetical protein